jgi:hypothetical protein
MKNIQTKYKLNFKTMKKGLLTLLAASLVFVGCQNYDDQFDDLNAQISALKSQVDGLSSLSGQVSALSGTIAGLQSGIAAAASSSDLSALSASLTALQADVDAVQASLATAATASAVAALQTELDALESDLDDLLVSNNVYSTAVTVNSAASMASALALGNKVALMNAAVTITDDATIADTDIQTFIDRIKTMNGAFTYSSGSATGYAATFDELTAATTLDITQAGDISFKKLASATDVTITTSYSTKITSVDMGAMTSVTSIASGADGSETANSLTVSSATNVDLGSLARYGAALSITTKKGATLDIASLDDVTAAGLQSDLALTLSGPASVSLTKIDDGTITLSNVAAATVSGFYGTLDIDSGVETLTTTDSVTIDLDGAVDLVTATLDFKFDWDPALTTAQAAVADDLSNDGYLEDYATSASIGGTDLKTLTVSGELLDLYLDEANLETLTLTGVTMHGLTISNMDDLTTLSVASGNKIGDISLTGSDNLTVANFDHTTNLDGKVTGTTAGTSTSVETGVDFVVTDNLGLTKLHTTGDHVDTFTVTGNDALAELDMTGLKDFGTTTEPSFALYDNDLTATKGSDTYDGETATATTGADGGTADAGSWDDGTSGMDTMKVYFTALAAEADSDGYAGFDTVSTFDNTDASETATVTTTLNVLGPTSYTAGTTASNDSTVLEMIEATANSADAAKSAIAQTMGWYVDQIAASGGTVRLVINGANIPAAAAYTLTGNDAFDAAQIASATNVADASSAGAILNAKVGAYSTGTVSLLMHANDATTQAGERYASTAALTAASTDTTNPAGDFIWSVDLYDTWTLGVGSNSVTVSIGGALGGSGTATTLAQIETSVVAAWAAKYGIAGTASASAIATLVGAADGVFNIQMLQSDSGGYDKAITFSMSDAGTAAQSSRTGGNIGWMIGATKSTGDNSTVASANDGLIITVTSKEAGSDLNTLTTVTTATDGSKATMVAFATNYTANETWSGGTGDNAYAGTQVERTDVVNVEESVAAATSNAVAQTLFNRVTWLG